jgi:hypothetical protein
VGRGKADSRKRDGSTTHQSVSINPLTYADVCRRMLTYADGEHGEQRREKTGGKLYRLYQHHRKRKTNMKGTTLHLTECRSLKRENGLGSNGYVRMRKRMLLFLRSTVSLFRRVSASQNAQWRTMKRLRCLDQTSVMFLRVLRFLGILLLVVALNKACSAHAAARQ